MTTFPLSPEPQLGASKPQRLRAERYAFEVGGKHYTLQFLPLTYLDGYDDRQLAALSASVPYEVSFRLEAHTLPDGTILSGYDTFGTGDPFRVLGGVANGIVAWLAERQPTFLYWQAQGTRRQRLYDRMIQCFAARGSGWHRLAADPFTGSPCRPEAFWLGRLPHHAARATSSC